jgi:hypothetical protein
VKTSGIWSRCAPLAVAIALLSGCGGGGGGDGGQPTPPTLALSTASLTVGAGGKETAVATGGQPPYTYSITSGGGSIDSATGVFAAPSGNGTIVIEVTDSRGASARVTLTVSVLTLNPPSTTADSGGLVGFTPSGGAPPYTYNVVSGGGSVTPSGQFTAPTGPTTSVVGVTDSTGANVQANVTVNLPLVVPNNDVAIGIGSTYKIDASGGQGPFTYKVLSGGGTVDSDGNYSASKTAGSVVVQITDSLGSVSQITLNVGNTIAVTPASATLTASSGQTVQFTGGNGVAPYTYTLASGSGSIDSQGVYTVGAVSGLNTIKIVDSLGNLGFAQVRALRIRVNGGVFSTVSDSTSLYLGGRFTAANPYSTPRLAVLDPVSGNPLVGCDLGTGFIDGGVTSVVTSGNSIYVAGYFNHYRGAIVGKLAKIDATSCKLDTTFTAGGGFGLTSGQTVQALAISGNVLYAAGNFSSYRGATARYVVKLDLGTGAPDPNFAPGSGPDFGPPATMAVSGSAVYLGGTFSHYSGVAVSYVVKLDALSGAVDATFAAGANPDGPVTELYVSGDSLYLSGMFTHYDGIATGFAKASATTGAVDATFTNNVIQYSNVAAICQLGTSLYVGNRFNSNGVPILSKMDAFTGVIDPTFTTSSGFDFDVTALMVTGSALYAGGYFTTYRGAPAYNIAKLDANTGFLDTIFTRPTGGNDMVASIAMTPSAVIVGGQLTTYRGQPVNNLAKFALSDDTLDTTFSLNSGTNSNVLALGLDAGSLYLGGLFYRLGNDHGGYGPYVAKVDAATGLRDSNFVPPLNFVLPVFAMAIGNGSLYVGGLTNPGTPHVQKLDLLTGQPDPVFTAGGTPDGLVNALLVEGPSLYIGGRFQHYGSAAAQNLAKVDLSTGVLDQSFTQSSGAGGESEYVNSLAVTGGSLYVGGNLQNYRGATIQGLIKVDEQSGALDPVFTHSSGIFGSGEALLVSGSSLWVAGNFNSYRGSAVSNLIKLDLASGDPDPAFGYGQPCDSCASNFDSLNLIGTRLFVGADAATLYRGSPTYFEFPVDSGTGALLDP